MRKKFILFVMAVLMINGLTIQAQTNDVREIKYKRQIVEYGTNQHVKIRLTSQETLEGRIAEISNDSFTLQLVDQTGQVINREFSYAELSNVSKVDRQKATSTLKRGVLYGAGIYAGMLLVSLAVVGIIAAATH